MENFANSPITTLNGAIDNSQTTITVANSTGFPAPDFRIRIDAEIMKVTGVAGNDWTVVRAAEPVAGVQVARAHEHRARVAFRLTAASLPLAATGTGVLNGAKFTSINVTTGTLAAGDASGALVTHLTSTNAVPGDQAMRTPAQVLADTPGLVVGMSYYLRILNTGAGVFTLATDSGAGFTMTGTMTIATNNMREFIVTLDSATTGTVQSLGLTAVTAV
jgi:hypothetical protein